VKSSAHQESGLLKEREKALETVRPRKENKNQAFVLDAGGNFWTEILKKGPGPADARERNKG